MSNSINRHTIIESFLWKLLERGGAQFVGFVVTIILARLLSPTDYGLVAISNIFISIATVFVQSGLNVALIQKKQIDELDKSTVFFFSVTLFAVLYTILYFSAPHIAVFFNNNQVISIIRVIGLSILFGAFNSIQIALLTREMAFKQIFRCSFFSIFFSGVAGVVFAYNGLGVWSLVIQMFCQQIIQAFALFNATKWCPKLQFSWIKFKSIYSFSINIMLTNLLTQIFLDLRSIVIGRFYTAADLSFFEKGKHFPQLVMNNVNTSILSVLFPAFTKIQDDKVMMKSLLRRSIKTISFLVFPLMVGLVFTSESIIELLLTERWLPAVPYMQIFAIIYMFSALHQPNIEAIKAMGRGKTILHLDIIRKIIEIVTLVISIKYGPLAIAIGALIASFICIFVNLYPNKSLLKYGYIEQLKDIFPSLMISVSMGYCLFLISKIEFSSIAVLSIQVLFGVVFYFASAYIFKLESYNYLLNIIRKKK